MKKRWMVLGIIIALVMGYWQMWEVLFQAVVQAVVEAVVVDEGQLIAHILICLIGDDMGRRIRLLC